MWRTCGFVLLRNKKVMFPKYSLKILNNSQGYFKEVFFYSLGT